MLTNLISRKELPATYQFNQGNMHEAPTPLLAMSWADLAEVTEITEMRRDDSILLYLFKRGHAQWDKERIKCTEIWIPIITCNASKKWAVCWVGRHEYKDPYNILEEGLMYNHLMKYPTFIPYEVAKEWIAENKEEKIMLKKLWDEMQQRGGLRKIAKDISEGRSLY